MVAGSKLSATSSTMNNRLASGTKVSWRKRSTVRSHPCSWLGRSTKASSRNDVCTATSVASRDRHLAATTGRTHAGYHAIT